MQPLSKARPEVKSPANTGIFGEVIECRILVPEIEWWGEKNQTLRKKKKKKRGVEYKVSEDDREQQQQK